MDKRRLDATVKGFARRREQVMDDTAAVGHILAGKVAEAVWGNRKFGKPIKPFKLSTGKKQAENFRDISDTDDIHIDDNKQVVQSFDNQLKLFLQERGGVSG